MVKKTRRPRGSVEELDSGRFRVRYIGTDKKRYSSRTFSNDIDAQRHLDQINVDIDRGVWVSPRATKTVQFGVYAQAYLDERVTSSGKQLSPKTLAGYRHQLEKGLKPFAEMSLTEINSAQFRSWHKARSVEGRTAAASESRLLRAILNVAIKDKIIKENPVEAKYTKTSAGHVYRAPTVQELSILHAEVDARFQAGVLIAAYGGLRISEWRALRKSDLEVLVDDKGVKRYFISVTRQAQYISGSGWVIGPPKYEGVRNVLLPGHLFATLESHIKEYAVGGDDALLFPATGGSKFFHDSAFNKSWRLAQAKARVKGKVREHDLRDFAATHIHNAGAPAIAARDFLGHRDLRTTERSYLHNVTQDLSPFVDRMPVLPPPPTTIVGEEE